MALCKGGPAWVRGAGRVAVASTPLTFILTVIVPLAFGALGLILIEYVSCPLSCTPKNQALGEGMISAKGRWFVCVWGGGATGWRWASFSTGIEGLGRGAGRATTSAGVHERAR